MEITEHSLEQLGFIQNIWFDYDTIHPDFIKPQLKFIEYQYHFDKENQNLKIEICFAYKVTVIENYFERIEEPVVEIVIDEEFISLSKATSLEQIKSLITLMKEML